MMQMRSRIITALAPAAAVAALVAPVLLAGPASATTQHTYTVVTKLSHRSDSGGNGNWAYDSFNRTAKVVLRGTAPLPDCGVVSGHCYAYTASLSDKGSFAAIPGAYTPNQGAPFTGDTISGHPHGNFHGYGLFGTFYANQLPHTGLVPRHVNGDADPSYLWPTLFFSPSATLVGAGNENDWGYTYRTTSRHLHQRWVDASFNSGGQVPAAGNISGEGHLARDRWGRRESAGRVRHHRTRPRTGRGRRPFSSMTPAAGSAAAGSAG